MEKLAFEEEIDKIDLRHAFNEYLDTLHPDPRNAAAYLEELHDKIDNIENLFPHELLNEIPAATIAIPVHATHADTNDLIHTLHLIQRAAPKTGPLEVLLWTNNQEPYCIGLNEEAKEQKLLAYDKATLAGYKRIVDAVAEQSFDPSLMRVRVGQHQSPQGNYNIFLDIRTSYMDVIAVDAIQRGFSAWHPVIWLDGDTTFIAKGSFDAIISYLSDEPVFFAKPSLRFTGHPDDPPLHHRTPNELYAALYGITRNILERNMEHDQRDVYTEECGLGMRLGDYYYFHGLYAPPNTSPAIGESKLLATKLNEAQHEPIFGQVPGARFGTSYRSIQARISYSGEQVNVISSTDQDSYASYYSYSELQVLRDQNDLWKAIARDATKKDLEKLFIDLLNRYKKLPNFSLPERQQRILGKVVARISAMIDQAPR